MPKGTPSAKKVNLPPTASASTLGGAEGGLSLPCLFSNNSIEITPIDGEAKAVASLHLYNLLSPYHKRQAHTLYTNVHRLVTVIAPSIGHVGFLTLTTPDKEGVHDKKEISKRFNSFNTNFLSKHPDFKEWVMTPELHPNGHGWHFHAIIVMSQDIREGVNFEEIENRKYSSASPFLRRIWGELREAMPRYGLGRPELLPIKSNGEGIARYVGKYISKHVGKRKEDHKGMRMVNYSKGWLRNGCQFAWNTKNSSEWRRKLPLFAERAGCQEFYQLSAKLGTRWAFKYQQDIIDIDQAIFEDQYNAKHEERVITRAQYVDPTITRAKAKKAAREKKMRKELVNHARVGVSLEGKRKIELAKQDIKRWIEEEKEEAQYYGIVGNVTMSGEKLVYRTGTRAGEEIF